MKNFIFLFSAILSVSTLCSCQQIKSLFGKEQALIVGGYSATRSLTDEEEVMFKQVTANLKGAEYEPENVSTQIVAGINYRFLCTARLIDENGKKGKRCYAVIVIHKPLNPEQQPRILSIEREPR